MSTVSVGLTRADARLMAIALVSAALSVLALLIHALGGIPLVVTAPIVAVPAAIGVRCLMLVSARSASSSRRAQVILFLSVVGVAVSVGNLALALPTLLKAGGPGPFIGNALGSLWTMALLAVVTILTRTFTWRAVFGAFFVGLFAVPALAELIERPAILALGAQSTLAIAVVVPITEEVLKALPMLIIVLLAWRHRDARPSAGDIVLAGVAVGAGFALYEDALFGRGTGGGWTQAPPFSLLIPSIQSAQGGGTTMLAAGHVVWTATVALGLAIAVLYTHRFRLAWLALPIALAAVLLEHMTANGLSVVPFGGSAPPWVHLTSLLTLDGALSTLLLIAGLAAITTLETRSWRRAAHGTATAQVQPIRALLLPRRDAASRSEVFAQLQAGKVFASVPRPDRHASAVVLPPVERSWIPQPPDVSVQPPFDRGQRPPEPPPVAIAASSQDPR